MTHTFSSSLKQSAVAGRCRGLPGEFGECESGPPAAPGGRVGSLLFAHVRPRINIVRRYGGHASGADLGSDDHGHVRVGPQDPLRSLHLSNAVPGVRGRRSLLDWLGRGTDPLDFSTICRCPPRVKQCRGPCFYQFGRRRSGGQMPFQWRSMLSSCPRVTEDSYGIASRCRHGTPNVGWLTFAS